MDLSGAIAAVTGAGSGLGRALVARLAQSGSVPVVLDLRADRVEGTLAELKVTQPDAVGWRAFVREWSTERDTKLTLLEGILEAQTQLLATRREDTAGRAFRIGDTGEAE